jgi:hypothetical protein
VSRRPSPSESPLPGPLARVYRRLLPLRGRTLADAADELYVDADELRAELAGLVDLGVVTLDADDVLQVLPPAEAASRYVARQASALADAAAHLDRVALALPALAGLGPADADRDAAVIEGEVAADLDVPRLLTSWVRETQGDIIFLRPDQWRMSSESHMARVMDEAIRQGRRVRAIYPVRALREAPEVLVARASIGEQIRVLAQVPTRLAIIGPHHAIAPDPLGVGRGRHVVVRQQSLVELLTRYVDELWDRATAVPALDRGEARPDLRRLLLAQLARGAKDEQIARTLGISLRTTRRRVAALMAELGADSRFQAGVEAVRRGWL